MYIRFKILEVKPLLGKQAIIIESTHEINPLSIKPENIRITNPDDSLEELLWIHFDVDEKKIIIYLEDTPLINKRYLVRIKNLQNIMDDTLETCYSQSIVFLSYINSNISFKLPVMYTTVPSLSVEIEEEVINDKQNGAYIFEYEIASDALYQKLLVPNIKTEEKQFNIDIDFIGQIFIRCRAHYAYSHNHNDEQKHTHSWHGDWITTTCSIQNISKNESDNVSNNIALDLDIISKPMSNSSLENYVYVFDVEEITKVDNVIVTIESINNEFLKQRIDVNIINQKNKLIISPIEKVPKNSKITIELIGIHSDLYVLQQDVHTFYSELEPCYGDLSDILSLIDIEVSPELVYYYLIEASKLADYYADIKLNGHIKNLPYYNKVEYAKDFEKKMFVKYYVASQVLSHARSGLAYRAGYGGKLGEIEYAPKGSLPDLTSVLKRLLGEAEKWKLALQGYKDHPADSRSVVRSSKCLPHNHIRGGR